MDAGAAHRSVGVGCNFSTIMNVGALILPMLGLTLANTLGIRTVLPIGGGIRLSGAMLFYLSPVQGPETEIR